MKTYKGFITKLEPNEIFVFGSNTEGRHGAGAAKQAVKFGAVYGQAKGRQGQTYAIVTKDLAKGMRSIPKSDIVAAISELYEVAWANPKQDFLIAYSGTGKNLNGYSNQEMVVMFGWAGAWDKNDRGIPPNIVFEEEFAKLLQEYMDNK